MKAREKERKKEQFISLDIIFRQHSFFPIVALFFNLESYTEKYNTVRKTISTFIRANKIFEAGKISNKEANTMSAIFNRNSIRMLSIEKARNLRKIILCFLFIIILTQSNVKKYHYCNANK